MTISSSFDACLKLVLASEGGYSNDPQDPGGATNKGVTQRVYDAYRTHMGQATRSVREINDGELADLYRIQYWQPIRGISLPSGVSYAVFDWAVNSGVARASKALQKIVGAVPDGQIGVVTLAAVAETPPRDLINHICDLRQAFLEGLPTFGHFGKGWTARVKAVRTKALEMAKSQPRSQAA